jgi:pimeloyl-ACP methyl ester carboxylesterase
VHDLQAAMDRLESMLGIHRFIVIGLRSGARQGLGVAVADARVAGLLMFDGFAFPGRRSRWDRRLRQALLVAGNPGAIAGTLQALARKPSPPAPLPAASPFGPDRPEITMGLFRRSMTQLAERGVAVLLLYSGSLHVVDHDRDQLGPLAHEACMRDVDYRFVPGIDQSLISVAAQQSYMAIASDWVLRVTRPRAMGRPARLAVPSLPAPPVERVVLRTA